MNVLEATGIIRDYRIPGSAPIRVLKGVSLTVAAGERVAITGRSGAGKSTLLNILGGLDKPTSGHVTRTGRVGFVFQSFHLMPELTVLENALLPVRASGRITAAARARAKTLLEKAGLAERLDHLPAELSGGEQQRVALVRALICDPELVFADEPTGNLDALTGAEILKLLFELDGVSRALVMVTHSEDAAAQCDRRLVLEAGCLM